MAPPRVLLVEDELGDDGATRSNLRLVARWRTAGAPVVLFALRRADVVAALPAGVVPLYPARGPQRLRYALLLGLWRLVRLARHADVVVAGRELGWGLILPRAAALLAGRPFVAVVRSEPRAAIEQHISQRLQPLTRRALTSAQRVVCISPGLVPALHELGVDPRRVRMVLNGVELDAVRAAGRRPARLVPGLRGPVVVGVGRLEHQKGFDVLLRAHAEVRRAGVEHTLLLLGEGRDRALLEAMARELGVADSVHMPGFVADPLPEVAAADLFCLASRWEGFGQGLAEAVVLATPSVATDCVSGPRHLLAGGAHGDLVPVDDVAALARSVRLHLSAPARLRDAAQLGARWAAQHLDVDRSAAQVLDVLQDVAERRR